MTPTRDRDLMTAFATELADVADGVEALSALLNGLISGSDAIDRADALRRAQAVDALVQRCRALGEVAAGVAAGRDPYALIDAVPLADLADRLRAAGSASFSVHNLEARPVPGDLHLFD